MAINEEGIKSSFLKIREDINQLNEKIESLTRENFNLKAELEKVKNNQVQEQEIQPKQEGLLEPTINDVAKIKQRLTMSEQEIVMCLTESTEALTYKQISIKLGKAANTVKGQIVNMLNKGLPIESTITLNNQKAYTIKAGMTRKFALTPNRFEHNIN